jgi:hypothetical protein
MEQQDAAPICAFFGDTLFLNVVKLRVFQSQRLRPSSHIKDRLTSPPGSGSRPLRMVPIIAVAVLLASCGGDRSAVGKVAASVHPLVAEYSVESHKTGQVFVEFGTDTTYGRKTAVYDVAAGETVPILVAGMKPSTMYHMRANLQADGTILWKDHDRTFTTGAQGPTRLRP